MVDWAVVEWDDEATRIDKISELDDEDAEFYAVYAARKDGRNGWEPPTRASLLYIGIAYSQTVRERFKQNHASYNHLVTFGARRADRELIVVLGWLPKGGYSVRRVTEKFVKDIEALLIHENQPKFNSKHKKSYGGRPLVAISGGDYKPLKWIAMSSDAALTKWEKDGGWEAIERYL